MSPEEKKEYMKEYRQRNKDKLRQQKKEYEERKKKDEKYQSKIREYKRVWANEHYDPEKSAEYYKNNKELCDERNKRWRRETPNGQKYSVVSNWKRYGVIHDNFDDLYNHYINTDKCDVCKCEFHEKNWRCLDHDHDTGKFRQVLCNACNTNDSWKKKVLE